MKKSFSLVWSAFLSVALLAFASAAELLPEKPVEAGKVAAAPAAAWQKSLATYKRIVTDLAAPEMEGRGPGTKGLDMARDYLVKEFKQIGLAPAFKDAKGEMSFLQQLDISAGIKAKEQALVLLDKDGKTTLKPVAGEQFSARGFSGDGEVAAEAVFVGYGVSMPDSKYDSFATMTDGTLKGKVAVAYRFEPVDDKAAPKLMKGGKPGQYGEASSLLNKAKWAADRGAAALLVVDPPSRDADGAIPSVAETQGGTAAIPVMQVTPDVFRAMLRGAGLGDDSTSRQWEKDANENATKVKALDGVKVSMKVNMERVTATIHNVGGVLPGAGKLKDEYLVIGGHYDHLGFGGMGSLARTSKSQIHHGADDNASGTAGVVISAMRFAELAKNNAPADRRTVLFVCFSGEERGLLGSAHMLRKITELGIKPEQIVAMLNLDMIGRMDGNKLIASGSGSGDKFEELIQAASKEVNLDVKSSAGMGIGGSDHQSFHTKSIPAVHFFTGVHTDYHKPSDTAEKINMEGGAKTTELTILIARKLWDTSDKIAFVKVRVAHPAAGGPRGGGAYSGIVPNYASLESNDGCVIDGTSAGSPAEAAGLKGDDVILAWDKTAVKNLNDLMTCLQASKPGQEVTLKVKRGQKEAELKVKLGTR